MEPLLLVRWSTLLLSSLVNFANHHRARLRVSEPLSSVSAEEASVSERQVEASRKILEARLAKHATALASAKLAAEAHDVAQRRERAQRTARLLQLDSAQAEASSRWAVV